MSLKDFRSKFQPIFRDVLHEKTQAAAALVPDAFVAALIAYPEQLAGGDGKRVRPYLVWLMAGATDAETHLRFVSFLELFHTFALVHDDIMDQGATRHGVPTAHVYTETQLKQAQRTGDLAHVGEAQGILLGDLLFQWTHEVFQEGAALFPAASVQSAHTFFNHMVNEVIVGQMIDADIATRRDVTMELVHSKMRLKTASYTFIRPMQIGLALAGMETGAAWVTQFGESLGIAFQIQDDHIDLTATNVEAGKTIFSDLHANQPTIFTQHIVENGTDTQRAELTALMGAELTEADRERVTRLFTDAGAFAFGESEIERLLAKAEAALKEAPEPVRAPLTELIQAVRQRAS